MRHLILIISSGALLGASLAVAQVRDDAAEQDDSVDLETIEVVDTEPPAPAYLGFDPVDTGRSVLERESIRAHETGDGDMLDALRLLPNISFDVNQQSVRREDLQDLRPSDIAISGAQFYDNNIRIDGVGVNNLHDVTNDNPFNFNEVAGSASQTIFVDPTLIEALDVQDSNVSARYGNFTGGVVDAVIRDPLGTFGGTVQYGYQNEDFVRYITDGPIDAERAELPPEFTRWKANASVDLPINDRLLTLVSLGRHEAEVLYPVDESYGDFSRALSSRSDNLMLRSLYRLSDDIDWRTSLIYSPYESEAQRGNSIDSQILTEGGGLTFYTELEGASGDWDWRSRLSHAYADMSREAPQANFSWSSDAPSIDFCTNRNCSAGGFGALEQWQRDWVIDAEAERALGPGTWAAGATVEWITAFKERSQEARAYSRGDFDPGTVCASPNDPACIDGEIALPVFFSYQTYEAEVDLLRTSLWTEYSGEIGALDYRAGLRYSHDDFLDNHKLAPRLSAAWTFANDWSLSAGLNRYYGAATVAYAIRSQYPDFFRFVREPREENGQLIFSEEDWRLDRVTALLGYREQDLDTPYSDEATIALTIPTEIGSFRAKAVYREHRDQLTRSPIDRIEDVDGIGEPVLRRVYVPTNDGETDYLGLSLEYSGSWRNHTVLANIAWSETNTNFSDYISSSVDLEELESELVLYRGEILSLAELDDRAQRENFATPLQANLSLQSVWFDSALRTTVWVYWRDEYETIGRTFEREEVDGITYRVWEDLTRDASTRVDLNLDGRIPTGSLRGELRGEIRVTNLFSELPATDVTETRPYQRGRTFWLGLRYAY